MSNEVETVDIDYDLSDIKDSLYARQKEGVANMRTSLLACNVYKDDTASTLLQTMNNITVMRVYHQLMRIIKYTEMMDKLEDKMYEAMDEYISSSSSDVGTLIMLTKIQESLQKSMIESHKLLQPYMDAKEFNVSNLLLSASEVTPGPNNIHIIDSQKREHLRTSAHSVLKALNLGTGTEG